MIYCVWYPSGGFGHFVNAILTLHGSNFVKPAETNYEFSQTGNSHQLKLVAPKYFHDPDTYDFIFDKTDHYSVLIDNGINNQAKKFCDFFPDARTIKICYSDLSWPVIAHTMITKAMCRELDSELEVDSDLWPTNEIWAQREKYFLYLRDNHLKNYWKPEKELYNLMIEDLFSYSQIVKKLNEFDISVTNFENLWNDWFSANYQYIQPVLTAKDIIDSLYVDRPLNHITDVWTQAVVYYYIWLTFDFEVPHNDHKDWFTNSKDIVTMLDKHGVSIDSNQKSFC